MPLLVFGQTDSLPVTLSGLADSVKSVSTDSAAVAVQKTIPDSSLQEFYLKNLDLVPIDAPLVFLNQPLFFPPEKDLIFYFLAGLLLTLGLIRLLFSKYFRDLFRIFFQTTFRQKSIREQLLQNKMPSMLLNLFFCVSAGLFLFFVAQYKGWLLPDQLIQKTGLCMAFVAGMYGVKYVGLQIIGWLFGMNEVTDTYLFIVFLINKVIGVMLLPAVILLALGGPGLGPVLVVSALVLLAILFVYRYLIALPLVRNHAGLTGLHFFIYLCAFEVIPVLLVYKLFLFLLSR